MKIIKNRMSMFQKVLYTVLSGFVLLCTVANAAIEIPEEYASKCQTLSRGEKGFHTVGSFGDGAGITEFKVPDTLEKIGAKVFYHWADLKTADLFNTKVRIIEESAFYCCHGLEIVKFPSYT